MRDRRDTAQPILRLPKSCGYGAQEFISGAAESGNFDFAYEATLKFANDSAGAKGGPLKRSAFFVRPPQTIPFRPVWSSAQGWAALSPLPEPRRVALKTLIKR